MAIKLIVGLGNPGPEYQKTRHNAGVWLVEAIANHYLTRLTSDKKFHGLAGKIQINHHDVHLLVPTTYMNRSGLSVNAMCRFYKISVDEILVAHDELDLEPGSIRLKKGGGHGGHNGLRDIINQLGNKDFYRLRLGIGHPGNKSQVTGYVLGKPPLAETEQLFQGINSCIAQLDKIVSGEHQSAMNLLHQS